MKENHSSQNAQESGTSSFTRLRSKLSFERMVEMGAKMGMENPHLPRILFTLQPSTVNAALACRIEKCAQLQKSFPSLPFRCHSQRLLFRSLVRKGNDLNIISIKSTENTDAGTIFANNYEDLFVILKVKITSVLQYSPIYRATCIYPRRAI